MLPKVCRIGAVLPLQQPFQLILTMWLSLYSSKFKMWPNLMWLPLILICWCWLTLII